MEPVQVSDVGNIKQIACGSYHSLAIDGDGRLWAWGINNYGQCGAGDPRDPHDNLRRVTSDTGFATTNGAIAGGSDHSIALKSNGSVWTTGRNNAGQCGDGTPTTHFSWIGINLTGIKQVAAGRFYSLALKTDGTLWGWGYNGFGQLGDGTTTDPNTPINIPGAIQITQIAAGDYHTLVLKADGSVWTTGQNDWGQLGNGTTLEQHSFVKSLVNAAYIGAGSYHSFAVVRPPALDLGAASPNTVYYGKSITVPCTLLDRSTRQGIFGESVLFYIDGKLLDITPPVTNSTGSTKLVTKIDDDLTPGTHYVTAYFAGDGDKSYLDTWSTKPVAFKILKTDTKATVNSTGGTKSATLSGRLQRTTDSKGLAGKTIKIQVDLNVTTDTTTQLKNVGVATTDSQGKWSFTYTFPSGFKKGDHYYYGIFAGTSQYAGSSASNKLTAK